MTGEHVEWATADGTVIAESDDVEITLPPRIDPRTDRKVELRRMYSGAVKNSVDLEYSSEQYDEFFKSFLGDKPFFGKWAGWFELSINGRVFGRVRNFERQNPNQTRAEFKPAPYFGDLVNDKRAMEFNSVLFCHGAEVDNVEVFFERRDT